ncbi:MAG: magnesium transporter CorA family protein [Patescibacteria group bacterium]|nr:magnesium transporter CorA family protein [Patescibacteria group bacterium]
MINIYKKTLKDSELKNLKNFEEGSWVSVVNPNIDEIKILEKKLDLDLTIVEDALDENEISRIEKNGEKFYIIIRFPFQSDLNAMTMPLLVAITEDHIVTLCKEKNELIENIIRKGNSFYTTHKTNFILRVILEVFNNYDLHLNKILKDIKIKKINLNKLENKDILFLVQEEETLNDFISSLVPIINNLERVLSGRYIPIYEKDKDMIEDLFMDSKQTLEISKTALKSMKNIREAYSTILTNELNKIMRILTVATIILTVPTIISSIYGMNISLPIQNNSSAFLIIILIIILFSLLFFMIIKKKKWM